MTEEPTGITGGTKARNWSITINNPTQEDYAGIEQLKAKTWCKEWRGQLEAGENGTQHIQAALKTDNVKFSMVKKCLKRAHIEPARNAVALRQYVHKQETRIATLPTTQATSLSDIQQTMTDIVTEQLQHKGSWCYLKPLTYNRSNKRWTYTKEILDTDDIEEIVDKNWCYLEEQKANIFDDAINRLIRQGQFGAEMYGANVLTRGGLLKYFSSIIIRTLKQKEHASGASVRGAAVEPAEESLID